MDSILNSVKKVVLGSDSSTYNEFDTDIIMHINTVFSILNQLGVGPETGFAISGSTETWTDFFGNTLLIEMVKSYTCLKVKMMFDPPQNGALIEAYDKRISELEWRINVAVDHGIS